MLYTQINIWYKGIVDKLLLKYRDDNAHACMCDNNIPVQITIYHVYTQHNHYWQN